MHRAARREHVAQSREPRIRVGEMMEQGMSVMKVTLDRLAVSSGLTKSYISKVGIAFILMRTFLTAHVL